MNAPSSSVRDELERVLHDDRSRVGDVYRRPEMDAKQIADDLGVGSGNFVSNNRAAIRALLEGRVPNGSAICGQVASKVRSLRRTTALSGEAQRYLDDLEQRLSDAGAPKTPSRVRGGRQPQLPVRGQHTLRAQVEDEIRRRVKDLVERIRLEAGIDAVDYWAVVTSDNPIDVVVRLIRSRAEDGTFKQLADAGRLDLLLDSAVTDWTDDLPLQQDVVEEATARRDWFSS